MTMTEQTESNPLLSLLAEVKLTLGSLRATVEQQQKQLEKQAHSYEQPRKGDIQCAVQADGNGFAVLELGGPAMGRTWSVRKLTVGGGNPATGTLHPGNAPAGSAYVYRGQIQKGKVASLADLGFIGWEDFSTTLPNVSFYGSGDMSLMAAEKFYVIITGGTANLTYVAQGWVVDAQDAAYEKVLV